jgi:hypothetical protein
MKSERTCVLLGHDQPRKGWVARVTGYVLVRAPRPLGVVGESAFVAPLAQGVL